MIYTLYMIFGICAFFYEWSQGSSKKFALLIAIIYPVTICMGAIGWVGYGIYYMIKSLFRWLYKPNQE